MRGKWFLGLALLSLAAWTTGCPRSNDRGEEKMIKFSAGGELRPEAEGSPLFATGVSREAFPDVLPFLVDRDLVMVDFAGGVELGCQPLLRSQPGYGYALP